MGVRDPHEGLELLRLRRPGIVPPAARHRIRRWPLTTPGFYVPEARDRARLSAITLGLAG